MGDKSLNYQKYQRADALANTAYNLHTNRTQTSIARARHAIADRFEM